MAEIRYKNVMLQKIFSNKRGNSKYTKKYCNENKGKYEVFTGTTIGSFGFINTYDYDEELLTYTTDGENAGTIEVLKGKYNIGGHRAILFPKSKNLSILYFKYILQKSFFDNVKKGDVPSLTWSRIKEMNISVPIDEYGNFDIEKQKEIVSKYERIENKKREINEKLKHINEVYLDFMNVKQEKSIIMPFEKLFRIRRGKVISVPYIAKNKGIYPVYSTQLNEPLGYINSYMYDGEYLIWNTDGLGGYIRKVSGKFSITNIVGIMILELEYKEIINLDYVRHYLQPVFRSNIKGREGSGGKNEYTKLNSTMIKNLKIEVPIPIKVDSTFDLEKQNEVVSKYETIEKIKKSINENTNVLLESKIKF